MPRILTRRWSVALLVALYACGGPTSTPTREATAPPVANTPEAVLTLVPAEGAAIYVIVPQETRVSYSVEETLLNQNNKLNTAIGRTSHVEGQIALNLKDPSQTQFGTFTVDISTLQSDSSLRDRRIRGEWLESAKYPLATFVVRGMEGFPANPKEGEAVTFKLLGDLTVRQTTRAVTWDVSATFQNEKLWGTAKTFILMADFGVEPPNIANILIVKDGVTLTLDFVMRPTQ
jgi:polyisoprenoid-binding protein YceI